MKVLIITTWFYPDTAIGAKRPYYFAKYLAQFGHDVTVLRSGGILETIDPNLNPSMSGFQIQSYLGASSPAECFARGEEIVGAEVGKRNFDFLPDRIRQPLVTFYRKTFPYIRFLDWKNKARRRWEPLKKQLDSLKESGTDFDVVFATYSEVENLWAGEYAAKLFNCPWIMDLRDPVAAEWAGPNGYKEQQKMETRAIHSCAACTVISKGMANAYQARFPDKTILAIHNGYDTEEKRNTCRPNNRKLCFCYTGALYEGKRDLSALFAALQNLAVNRAIDLSNIQVDYAGRNFSELKCQAERFGVSSILKDYGYVSKIQASELQDISDFFVVASWNTNSEQGVLTGKFYEGIRAQKPILSFVTGSVPDSELYLMNEEYHYGFCYEECKKEIQFSALCKYIKEAYDCKMCGEPVKYEPKEGLAVDFCYDELTRKLETVLVETTSGV